MKTILVIGRAKGVWEEVDAANKLLHIHAGFDLVVAVNTAGCDYPYVDHWVSFHADQFEQWVKERGKNNFDPVKAMWTSTYGRKESAYEKKLGQMGVKRINYTGGGSSGLVAVLVALIHLQGTHIVLAGIPMEVDRGHYNQEGPWKEAVKHRSAWRDQMKNLKPNVRSMSGWTMQELGTPDESWLRSSCQTKVFTLF